MAVSYMVKTFVPKVAGCGAKDSGWDVTRCNQFEDFVKRHAIDGWRLHSSEYRQVTVKGCGGGNGAWLVCIFEQADACINEITRSDAQTFQKPVFCTGCGSALEVGVVFCTECGKKFGA